MALGSKKLGSLITKFERSGGGGEVESPSRRLRKRLTPKSRKKQVQVINVQIGDKINLLNSPWKDNEGMYPCKAIRRPDFAESAMVAYAGAAGARAVAQSSKQYLMIVDRHLLEFTKLNEMSGRVAFVSSVDNIYKMRLREEELIALFFKAGKDDPLILKCQDSSIVSQQIRAARGSGLVKKEATHKALHLIQEIQAQERALEYEPSLARVNEITGLYEKAVQQFLVAGDKRHQEVQEHKMKFLALPKVASIRKGTPQKPKAKPKREPEILEASVEYSDDRAIERMDSDETSQNWADFGDARHDGDDKKFDESVDNIMFEARQDFGDFNVGNEDADLDRDGVDDGDSFAFAEFDAMMNAAERELEEIRKM